MATMTLSAIGGISKKPVWLLVYSWILTIPFVFFAVQGNFPFEASSHPDTSSPLNGSSLAGLTTPSHELGFVGYVLIPGITYAIVMFAILSRGRHVVLQAAHMWLLTFLGLLTIASAFWSQNPFRSTYNGVFYFIDTLFAFYLILKYKTEELISLTLMAGGLLAVAGLLLALAFPRYAVIMGNLQSIHAGAWKGVFGDRTTAGKILVFLLSPAIIFRRGFLDRRRIAYIVLLLFMIYQAQAATARVVTVLYIAFMAALAWLSRFGKRSSLVLGGAGLTLFTLIAFFGSAYLPLLFEGMGRNATLTGRTEIWAILFRSVIKHPLLGYGFYSFWQGMTGESANAIIAAHWVFGYAHNGFLELCLQLGLVGVALFIVTLVQAMINAWYCFRHGCPPGVEWYIGLVALTIMYNLDEATVVWPNSLVSIMYVIACCGLANAVRQMKSTRKLEAAQIHESHLSLAR